MSHFVLPLTGPYACGERRCAGGYAQYGDGAAVGSEPSIGTLADHPETLSPPLFPSFVPWYGGGLLQIFLGFLWRLSKKGDEVETSDHRGLLV
jgi:hypothetical protein